MNQQALINLDGYDEYADEGRSSYVKMKEIRLCVDLTKDARAQGIPLGNFFLVDPNVGQNEKPTLKDIGTEFRGIVLRDAQRVEVYDQDKKQYLVSSSEFRAVNGDPIIIYDRTLTDGQEEITACLPYTNKADPEKSIYSLKQTRYPNLRTKYVAYILYEGEEGNEVVKFSFAATDNTGCEPKEFKPRGFTDPADTSFMFVKSRCHSEAVKNVMFTHVLRIFSQKAFEGSVDFIKGFEIVGRVTADRQEELEEALRSLYEGLTIRFQKKTARAWGNTIEKEKIVCIDERHIPYLVAHPRIFTQQEKLVALAPNVIVPEIAAPAGAQQPQRPRQTSQQDVIDVAASLDGSDQGTEEEESPKPTPVPVPASAGKKPRNKAEAIQQKKDTTEYLEKSGLGEANATAARNVRERESAQDVKKEDPGLQDFLAKTDTTPAATDGPEGW